MCPILHTCVIHAIHSKMKILLNITTNSQCFFSLFLFGCSITGCKMCHISRYNVQIQQIMQLGWYVTVLTFELIYSVVKMTNILFS